MLTELASAVLKSAALTVGVSLWRWRMLIIPSMSFQDGDLEHSLYRQDQCQSGKVPPPDATRGFHLQIELR